MSKFLADENVPTEVVELARQSGLDITWIEEVSPGPELNNVPDGVIELYDVVHDPGESRNLAGTERGRVKELESRLDSWWKARR